MVEGDEVISFGKYEVFGILTNSIFNKVVGTRPSRGLGVIMNINDERYNGVEGSSINLPS